MQLTGIHHVTAVSARIRDNYRFYTRVLGMRLVKRSVNQDDVSAYHLFYADAIGSPGTDLTFFDWKVPPERRGTNGLTRTHLRVRDERALEFWAARLREHDVRTADIGQRDGRTVLDFEDPEGLRLAFVVDDGAGDEPVPWERSPVPPEFQVRGLGPMHMSVADLEPTEYVLTEVAGMRRVREYTAELPITVFAMDGDGPHAELHVAVDANAPASRNGAGGVHHVAFRTPDDKYDEWAARLNQMRVPNSGPVDRFWFRSLYFREPNGVLFEIATDGPGFGVDEDVATLGEKIVLPPFLEPHREAIVANLVPIEE